MKKWELSILLGLIMALFIGNITAFAQQCDEVRHDVLRLHILANSDNERDQELKLAVRDAILEEASSIFAGADGLDAAEEQAARCLGYIEEIARRALQANGCSDEVRVELVNMYFETREYESFTMPAGRYDALRIIIGEGGGHNWWCVMYPPLCLTAATAPEESFTEEEVDVMEQQPVYEPRFAIVEFWEGLTGNSNEDLVLIRDQAEKTDYRLQAACVD